jgi:hypothetical protein
MGASIQARLDKETEKSLGQLVRRLGWTPSRVVREAVRLMAACYLPKGRRKIIGQGKFASGVGDLASNKEHLRDFGRK